MSWDLLGYSFLNFRKVTRFNHGYFCRINIFLECGLNFVGLQCQQLVFELLAPDKRFAQVQIALPSSREAAVLRARLKALLHRA